MISVDGRFINHSCDPNAQTQKWTVNGELRVGFFTTREVRGIINQLNKYFYKSSTNPLQVREGEELTFDYKYERYGNVAQKCYCGATCCRWPGWSGVLCPVSCVLCPVSCVPESLSP